MNEISSSTSTQTETVIETSDDGNGNIVETEVTVTRTYLYITVSHKTAEEMADQFGFNEDQREQMAELLADENNSLWSQVLYGITGGMARSSRWHSPRWGTLAVSRTGAGMVLAAVWNGAPAL